MLAEEAACTRTLCVRPDDNLVLDPPLGGQFHLHYSADSTKLIGTWRASASASAELQVDLTRFGQRAYDRDDAFYYGSFLWNNYDGGAITPETTLYDYAKMQVALTEGPLQTINGATYREVTDPRTTFAFPRVVSLPGGGDIAPVNTMLDRQRWATSFASFECLSRDYLSGGWMPSPFGRGDNPLSDSHQEEISVDATGNHPTEPLIDWVIAAYRRTPGYSADTATKCDMNENIAEDLGVRFERNDIVVFLIGGVGFTFLFPAPTRPCFSVRSASEVPS